METPTNCQNERGAAERRSGELNSSFSADGVDMTLIRWFLELTPYERLLAAQDMIDTVWILREAE
jgi:hypothetical protein